MPICILMSKNKNIKITVVDSGVTAMNRAMGWATCRRRACAQGGGPSRWLVEHHPPVEQYPMAPTAGLQSGHLSVCSGSDGPSLANSC